MFAFCIQLVSKRKGRGNGLKMSFHFSRHFQSVGLCASLEEGGVKFGQEPKNVTLTDFSSDWKETARIAKKCFYVCLFCFCSFILNQDCYLPLKKFLL